MPLVALNEVPDDVLGEFLISQYDKCAVLTLLSLPLQAAGPYFEPSDFSFTGSRRFLRSSKSKKSLAYSDREPKRYKQIKARQLVQPLGNRIDFFGGSELQCPLVSTWLPFVNGSWLTTALQASCLRLVLRSAAPWA